uniref:restriction endonuclease subunit S n=1 Tax=Segatella copri TaxID=165179 RepID=UPI0040299A13
MRKGWEYKKLGEICSSDLGKTLNKSKDVGNMRPYLCAINILWDSIDLTTLKEACFKDDEIDRYTVKYGDLLVCEGGDTGRAAIWDRKEPILYQNALHRLRFKEGVDARFIMYNLWHKKQIGEIDHKYSKGVTILHLVKSALLSISILLPPKSTQLAIVTELDKINELIRLKKEQLKDFDNLAQSLFYEMFGDPVENEKGWEVKKIKDIAKYYNGVAHEQDVDKDGNFVLINAKFISSEGQIKKYTSIQRFPLLKNDIVMVLSDLPNGKSLAKCFLIDEDNKYTLNQRICCFRGFEGSSVYLKNIINRNPYLLSFDNGKGQTNLRKGDVEKIPIPLPPLSLQRLFAQRIEQIEREKSEVQKSILDLETLLASRMQYWFE